MSTYVAVALPSVTRWRNLAGDLAHELLDASLAARIHVSLGQPCQARNELERALDALAQLDAAMPTEPPAAPAAGPPSDGGVPPVITTTNPVQRLQQVRDRVASIDRALAGIATTEQQRAEHLARTQPELDAATADYERARARLQAARAAHPGSPLGDLGSITRRGQLERERADLQAELDGDLAPWAGQ